MIFNKFLYPIIYISIAEIVAVFLILILLIVFHLLHLQKNQQHKAYYDQLINIFLSALEKEQPQLAAEVIGKIRYPFVFLRVSIG